MSRLKKLGKAMRTLVRILLLLIFVPVFAVLAIAYWPLLQPSQSVVGNPTRLEVLIALKQAYNEGGGYCDMVTDRMFLEEFWGRPFMIGFDIYLTDHPEHDEAPEIDNANRFGNLNYIDLPNEYAVIVDFDIAARLYDGGFIHCPLPDDFKYQAVDNWRDVLEDAKSIVLQDLANSQ
jgi:hypothetical protein